jgi:bifunctional UDP-N-acetylglucosamine pyrophosphorylase/glucosamine-1-phosphate N-acetyltransferase
MSAAPNVVIMAAGLGTRMRSEVPKVLHPVCGRPMLEWPIGAALDAGAAKVVVVGGPDRALAPVVPEGVELAVQAEPRGTGDAVRAAAEHLDPDATVLVLSGDTPLITGDTLRELVAAHEAAGARATVVTTALDDPSGYGRVVRGADGSVERVVETKVPGDATEEELAIREVNTGIYAFAVAPLLEALGRIGSDNAQGEEYLPDVLPHLGPVHAYVLAEPAQALGVNDRVDLARVTKLAQRRINEAHARNGVTIVDPDATVVDAGVTIGADTVVEPFTVLRGATRVGAGSRIGPSSTLTDVVIGDRATVLHSVLDSCEVRDGASVGPFAYLRPGALLREGAKAGTFVEIKNSDIGEGSKVPHLSYIGDADVGPGTNLGAATITANYDGRAKHRTTIGEGVRTSVDTTLVAPVTVGDGAYTAAGSVITEDVPPGALGVARARQQNIEDYARRRHAT